VFWRNCNQIELASCSSWQRGDGESAGRGHSMPIKSPCRKLFKLHAFLNCQYKCCRSLSGHGANGYYIPFFRALHTLFYIQSQW